MRIASRGTACISGLSDSELDRIMGAVNTWATGEGVVCVSREAIRWGIGNAMPEDSKLLKKAERIIATRETLEDQEIGDIVFTR